MKPAKSAGGSPESSPPFSRPAAWEHDISVNSQDTRPFQLLPSPAERPAETFTALAKLIPAWLDPQPALASWVASDTYPIPIPEDREGYSPGQDERYWLMGLLDFLKIQYVAHSYQVPLRRYLDFGCASGRVLRHFLCQSSVQEIWGSDINHRHIRWLWEHFPERIKPVYNHCLPTLPIEDNYLDLVSAFSVFTHIDVFETAWLAELRRILRPGGLAYLTIHNEATWELLRGEVDNPDNRLVQSLKKVDPEFLSKIREPLAEGRAIYRFMEHGPYRANVFHSNSFIHQVWGRFFEVMEIKPAFHVRQTVVVLRKPARD
jgi:SAM-dependent methyltransferase